MPIPKPNAGEEKDAFISRCMGNDVMNREHPNNEERAGICYSQWERRGKDEEVGEGSGGMGATLEEDLKQSMAEEVAAHNVYMERAKRGNADLYQHVAMEEAEHFEEFRAVLEGNGKPITHGAELEVRYVGKEVLLDFKGMNPAIAKRLGFTGIKDNEILILVGMPDDETQETIDHERNEYDMMMSGMAYWPAHEKLMRKEEPETMKYKDAKRLMAVKFVDEEKGIIEGIYAPFGGPIGGKDLQGEYFDKDTDFCEKWFASRPILYHHGMDDSVKAEVIGHDTATKVLDNGRWLQAQLDKSSKYWKELKQLILDGRMFFSSGAVPHLVEKAVDGKLLRWPWVETSLTVSPANPMATVDSIKAVEVLKALGATEEQLAVIKEPAKKGLLEDIRDAPVVDLTEEGKAMAKSMKVTCPSCKAQFDVDMPEAAGTPAADPKVEGTPPAPAGDKQPPATNPGVGQGMGAETHVASAGTETAGQSGQHQGATAAPDKPGGDSVVKAAEGAKGDTPKPAAMVPAKEPEPPAAATQASDNTASSTGAAPGKAIEVKAEDKDKAPKVDDATKAITEALKTATEGMKSMLDERLKSVEGSVKEVVKPLEERLKALEAQPADKGPIRRAANPANALPDEETASKATLKKMFDDPKTPAGVKAYIGEQLAADDISELIRQGPQRIGRSVVAEK